MIDDKTREKLEEARNKAQAFTTGGQDLLKVVDEILNDKPFDEIQPLEIVLYDEYGNDDWELGIYEQERVTIVGSIMATPAT